MAESWDRPAPPATRTVAYGDAPDQVFDVRSTTRPQGTSPPVSPGTIVVVHGGFWRAAIDRSHAGRQAQAYADVGFEVAVVEYRRETDGWEQMAEDLRTALRVIRSTLPEPVVLIGHSAGGHLATWLAHQPEAAGVRGVVSLAGCVDLALVDALDLDNGAARDLMGTDPEDDRERWAAADPAQLGWAPCPVTLLHGDDDSQVPELVSRSYADRSGGSLQVLPECGHYEFLDPASDAWAASLAAAHRYLTAD